MCLPDYAKVHELQVHQEAITKMIFNYEIQVIISGAEDGSIAMSMLIDQDPRKRAQLPSMIQWNEVLVQGKVKQRLEEEIEEKKNKIKDHEEEFRRKVDLRIKTQNRRYQEEKQKMQTLEEEGNRQIESMIHSREESRRVHELQMKDVKDNYIRQLTQMKRDNDKKLKNDKEKFDALLEQKEKMLKDFEKAIMQMK